MSAFVGTHAVERRTLSPHRPRERERVAGREGEGGGGGEGVRDH